MFHSFCLISPQILKFKKENYEKAIIRSNCFCWFNPCIL